MGLNISQPVVLTDDLRTLSNTLSNEAILLKEFQLENSVDYQIMVTQEKLAQMNYKYNKTTVLPDISGFYQHENVFNKNAIVFNAPNMVGIGMNIPIFSSGQRYERIGQAHLAYIKAKNTREQTSEALKMGYADAKSAYINSLNKYNSNKDNIKLSEKIYRHTLVKYNQGSASSLELTQAQNQYLQNQTNYFMSIFDLITAQNKLEKFVNGK
jgi:outer membrane protein TolC